MNVLRLLALSALFVSLSIPPACQRSVFAQQTLGSIERTTEQMHQLLPATAKIEVLATGFTWTEGPVWIGDEDGHLLFSDIPRNSIFKWQLDGTVSLFMSPAGYTGVTFYGLEPGANGLMTDLQGRLVLCEHGDRRLSVLRENGGKQTLVDNYQGKRLNSPNDGIVKSNGDIYFTDPPYGLPAGAEDPRRELDFSGVYRLAADGELTLLTKDIGRPNGIAFAPDEKTLYIAQSDPEHANWTAFAVKPDGTLGEGQEIQNVTDRVGKEPGLPDGLAVDQQGNLWASGPGGIYVMDKMGKLLGRLVTGRRTSNCCFGPDGYLYMTVDSALCRIKTNVHGLMRQAN